MEGKHHSFLDFHCVQWFKNVCRFIYTIIQYIWNKNFTPLVSITNKNSKNRRTLGTVIAKACNTPCPHLILSTWAQVQATPLLTQLSARHSEDIRWYLKCLCLHHPHNRPGWSPRFLTFAWSNSGCLKRLGSKPAILRLLSNSPPFHKIKIKNTNF